MFKEKTSVSTQEQRNARIPPELKSAQQWAIWKPADKRKQPFHLDGSTMYWQEKPESRLTFEAVSRHPNIETFITLESGVLGIDIDGCIDENGEIHPLVRSWLGSTYAEISPSGTGIKMWLRGSIPNNKALKNNEVPWGIHGGHTGIEVYADARPFTVTGNIISGCPSEINEAPEVLNDILVHFGEAPKARKNKIQPEMVNGTWDFDAWVYQHLEVEEQLADGYIIACPWASEHTTPGDTARIWEGPPHTFSCFHSHCSGREWKDVRLEYEPTTYDKRNGFANYIPEQAHASNGHNGHSNGKVSPKASTINLCEFSADDAGNGEAMHDLFGSSFVYNESVGWLYYTGTHWEKDEGSARLTKAAIETLRKRRHAAVSADLEGIVKATISDTKRINGAITCFRAHVVVSVDEFDNQEHLLNCKNGVINLKTGEITSHNEEQHFTYCVPVEYKEADAIEWLDYLGGIVGGGKEMIDYLQLALGYSLTGSTREECLFYVYGPTRSGKGTVSEIFLRLLPRPLATMVDFNSFTAKREGDVSNFDLAELKPSRIVFASESQRNQTLNPAKIKQLTGGDLVRAAFKHKQFFTYRPQFKVWMLSNWPVNGDPEDDALWGRVRVIPFPNSFLGKEDKGKKEHLKSDAALTSILYWGVQGAIKWYSLDSSGLQTPTYIADITKSQRDSKDFVQQWLDECCVEDSEAWTPNEVVIASYAQWCESNNVTPKKAKALAQSLQMKSFKTGVAKWVSGRTQKGVNGLKIPVSLWNAEEESSGGGDEILTDSYALRILRQDPPLILDDPIGDIPIVPVRSVSRKESVRIENEKEENQGENTESEESIELCVNCLDREIETPGTCELGDFMYCEKCYEE